MTEPIHRRDEVLDARAVHVFYLDPQTCIDRGLLTSYEKLLSDDEIRKCQRFVFEKDRLLSLVARALLRTVLSRYFDVDAHAWRFEYDRYGKPRIHTPGVAPCPQFSIAHTAERVMCAMSYQEVGVDVEGIDRRIDPGIARRFFAPSEALWLDQQPAASRQKSFLRLWTLKEAFLKAKGRGLSLPLDAVVIRMNDIGEPTIQFEPPIEDNPEDWQFLMPAIGSESHVAAVCIRRPPVGDATIVTREFVPLADQSE